MNDLITRELDQGLLTLAFNRPDKLNALNTAMYQQLGDLLLAAGEDPAVDVIILTGGPHCFTAGNDLRDFLDNPPTDLDSPVFRLMRVVMGLDKPLIAAVSGAAIGIGATLLLHCDQVLVSRSTKLRMPFAPLGVCPEFGSSLLLPRLLGQARAAGLLLGNALLDGEQAVAWGLANELHEDGEQCLAAARKLARQLQSYPQAALRISKRLIKDSQRAELEATVARESQLFIECLRSDEARAVLRRLIKD
ncbi:enoyl-CoA hydratase [Pseudomonas putida SJ3]|jgi:enoyl-CoA hydratase/carnithine racemase|uniref:Enoyl-CoA hydratase-related protein n=1 Tax=Pseudomonas fortuita TaxID=3233375 RepID=A0ACD4P0B8_9PSED|nr:MULTISPECIES: enoyl-CoA hydratase-related protein [Pseudomonas]ERT17582.1 enoyl-CoA hydratase [Pseudomonas putida SJ3]WAP61640.1 enoyl-CoA hydratase-related protein [Pseudomonas putida]